MMLNKQQTLLSQRKAAATVPCGRALISKQISPCVLSQQQRRSTAVIVASLTRKPEDMLANGASTAPHSALPTPTKRSSLRMGLPSKGRMAEDTQELLKECALSVYKPNPRQYVATIPQIPAIEVWFQRASDVVRKMGTGDLDLGIVGYDMFSELAFGDSNLVVVHEALNFGKCHLGLGIPLTGKFANINSLEALKAMPEWTAATPLRVVTGYFNIANRFFKDNGFEHVVLLSADGALEASPAMGSADIIFDLVSTGVTLRENNLKEISGGTVMQSQGILVANKKALMERPGLLQVVHELIERFDGHLKAEQYYSVVANMRGDSAEEVASLLLSAPGLQGLQGPTISPVFNVDKSTDTGISHGFYAATICVKKKALYASVKVLQKLGGSGVLVMPMTYIFDEEPARWTALLLSLGLDEHSPMVQRD